jgi:hypothetical protein
MINITDDKVIIKMIVEVTSGMIIQVIIQLTVHLKI